MTKAPHDGPPWWDTKDKEWKYPLSKADAGLLWLLIAFWIIIFIAVISATSILIYKELHEKNHLHRRPDIGNTR